MKGQRTSLGVEIGTAGGICALYLVSVVAGAQVGLVFALLALANAGTVWMAIRILKDPYTTDKTFEDQFYQDREDLWRCGREPQHRED